MGCNFKGTLPLVGASIMQMNKHDVVDFSQPEQLYAEKLTPLVQEKKHFSSTEKRSKEDERLDEMIARGGISKLNLGTPKKYSAKLIKKEEIVNTPIKSFVKNSSVLGSNKVSRACNMFAARLDMFESVEETGDGKTVDEIQSKDENLVKKMSHLLNGSPVSMLDAIVVAEETLKESPKSAGDVTTKTCATSKHDAKVETTAK